MSRQKCAQAMAEKLLTHEQQAAAILGVGLDQYLRMRQSYVRFMEMFDQLQYLEDPRAWGTVDTAIDLALARKRRERANQ